MTAGGDTTSLGRGRAEQRSAKERGEAIYEFAQAESRVLREFYDYLMRTFPLADMGFRPSPEFLREDHAIGGERSLYYLIWNTFIQAKECLRRDFCRLLRLRQGSLALCVRSDSEGMREAKKLGAPFHYECHAGLTDLAVPVHRESDGRFLGAIFLGQALSRPHSEAGFRRIWGRIRRIPGLSEEEMQAAYWRLPVLTGNELAQIKALLQLFAGLFAHLASRLLDYARNTEQLQRLHVLARRALAEKIIFDADAGQGAIHRTCRALGISTPPQWLLLFGFAPKETGEPLCADSAAAAALSRVQDRIEECLPDPAGAMAFSPKPGLWAVLLPSLGKRSMGAERMAVRDCAGRILGQVEAFCGRPCRLAIAERAADVSEIGDRYYETLAALQAPASSPARTPKRAEAGAQEPAVKASLEEIASLLRRRRFGECKARTSQLLTDVHSHNRPFLTGYQVFLGRLGETLAAAAREAGVAREEIEKVSEAFYGRIGGSTRFDQCRRQVFRLLEDLSRCVDRVSSDWSRARAGRLLDFMRERAGAPPTRAEAARRLALSQSQLARVVRNATGMSYEQNAARIRLETAKRLLDGGPLPIGEIADRLGFSTVGSFGRFFRRTAGLSPKAYRTRAVPAEAFAAAARSDFFGS